MKSLSDVVFFLRVFIYLSVSAWVVLWFGKFTKRRAEDVSLIVLGSYNLIAFAGLSIVRFFDAHAEHHSRQRLRRKARVFLYTHRTTKLVATFGDGLDFFITMLSVGSCLMYVVETYRTSLPTIAAWHWIEVGFSIVFLADYFLRLFVAVDSIDYLLSTIGIINVVTSMPILVYTLHILIIESARIDESTTSVNEVGTLGIKLTYLRLLRLAKLLRVLRAMNILRSAPNDSLYRELFGLMFTVLCLIFSAAGVYQWMENDDSCFDSSLENTFLHPHYPEPGGVSENGCIHFHLAFYWCAIEVLGRPRLIMEQNSTIIMLTSMVFLSVFLIPRQLANVIAVLQSTSKYQRMQYTPSSRLARHLVIVGHREFAAVNMLLYEFFHPDRGEHPVQDVVLLFPSLPERDIEWLLLHPAYIGRVTYLQGTPLHEKDLERASLGTAAAVIVLANKDSDQPRWHDGELLTCIQAMKAFWLKDIVQAQRRRHFVNSKDAASKFLRPRIITQVLLPETKEYLIELPGWTDRDVVVVCSEYVAWMLGMATLARGMATVVFNLTSHTEKQRYYRTRWYPRYEAGASQEIYSAKLRSRSALLGLSLGQAAALLCEHRCILLAAERVNEDHHSGCVRNHELEGLHLCPGPPEFCFQAGDRLLCIAKSHPVLLRVLQEIDSSVQRMGATATSSLPPSPKSVSTGGSPKREKDSASRRYDELARGVQLDMQLDEEVELHEFDLVRCTSSHSLVSANVPRGCEDVSGYKARNQEAATVAIKSVTPARLDESDTCPLEAERSGRCARGGGPELMCREDVVHRLSDQSPWTDHIVICGLPQTQAGRLGGRGLVTELIETLIRAQLVSAQAYKAVRVCVVDDDAVARVADLCMVEPVMMQLAHEGKLRAVSSDARSRTHLIHNAFVGSARAVIALPEHVGNASNRGLSTVEMRDGRARQRMVKQILDTNTVLTMQVARGCADRLRSASVKNILTRRSNTVGDKLHCVTLLLQESTSNLFFGHANMRHAGAAAASDPRWLDITPLNMSPLFATGELLAMTCFDRFAVEALFTPQVVPLIRMLFFGDRAGNRLFQMACPPDYVGCNYEQLLKGLTSEGLVPLGLLRFPQSGSTFVAGEESFNEDLPDAIMPYVMVNPSAKQVVMRASDLLFVLGHCDRASTAAGHRGAADSECLGAEVASNPGDGDGVDVELPEGPLRHVPPSEIEPKGSSMGARDQYFKM